MLFIVTRTLLNISLRQFLWLFAVASTIGTSLFRLPEKYHYAINKPIYCPVKTKKKKLFFQRPSKLKGILLWTTLFFVYAFVALVIENFHM